MTNMYVLEPSTSGKVVLHTTEGPLDVELWTKQAPKATKNFLQLCMEGYYDNTIFHRIVKDYVIQGGDPTGTGDGGESIYGAPFADEYNSRLRFTHRGLVACASFQKHQNGSQFFITLDQTPALNNKHTIFGKITGDSLYNLNSFNDYEVGEEDRPLAPPKIIRTEVMFCPFDDIVPREKKVEEVAVVEKQKGSKNFKLLSFGDEAEEDEEEFAVTKRKMVSSEIPEFRKKKKNKKSKSDNNSVDEVDEEAQRQAEREKMLSKISADNDSKKRTREEKSEMVQEKSKQTGDAEKEETTEEAWARLSKKQKKLTEEEERARIVREETKKLLKELKGSKQKDKEAEVEKTRDEEAKDLLRNQREKYTRKQVMNQNVDNLFENFRTGLKDPNKKSGIKTHELQFEADRNPIIDLHSLDEYSVFDPRTGKGLVEEEKRMNFHNQKLRAKKREEVW